MYEGWLSTFTRSQLIAMLAEVLETGVPPVPPPDAVLQALEPERRRGRPSGVSDIERASALSTALTQCFPHEVSLKDIARAAGLSYVTIVRMRQKAYLLPEGLRDYFLALPYSQSRYRLSPLWRAVLDLHNYTLLLRGADTKSLYLTHAAMWGPKAVQTALHSQKLDLLNHAELSRLRDPAFLELLSRAGWPVPPPEPREGGVEEECPILAAKHRALQTVGDVHKLLEYPGHNLPLDPTSSVPLVYTSHRTVVLERLLCSVSM